MSELERLCDLLFEVSNEDRLRILLQLEEKDMRVTDISRELGLSIQESSRHVSRLGEVGLARKDVEGFYILTNYGKIVLGHIRELEFTSKYSEYFSKHTIERLPKELVKRIGELADSTYMHNMMDFLKNIEKITKNAEEKIWLCVDQYPVNSFVFINEALDRGVKFKCVEPVEGIKGPNPSMYEPKEMEGFRRAGSTPLVEHRTKEKVDAFLFLSENECALAFPTPDGEFDYRGFTAEDERSIKWCNDLFQHYWETAEPRVYISPTEYMQPKRVSVPEAETRGHIIVESKDDSSVDHQAIQDAVDTYDEVILRGTFNIGTSTVIISRSVVIKGEGREDDVPLTKVYKSGWTFPFYHLSEIEQRNHVFLVDGEGADVTIENIHFTNFNYTCLDGHQGKSMTIRNNRITLETGLGRGVSSLPWGDVVIGIEQYGGFPGGVIIEGNYLDFALSRLHGGYILLGFKEDPSYRPDLLNHEYYIGRGILVTNARGKVIITNNVVRNANARAIAANQNIATADVIIKNNTIVSEIYGSYPFDNRWAGFGISVMSGWMSPSPRYNIEITDNTIKCDKLHYCGIGLQGPVAEGSEKLSHGIVKNNRIHLGDGSVGIFAESCDGFEITNNTLSGKAYYGITISSCREGAYENIVEDNNMRDLEIKDTDQYSDGLFDMSKFTGSTGKSATAHLWLNANTKANMVKVSCGETVVDEGEDNKIICEEKTA